MDIIGWILMGGVGIASLAYSWTKRGARVKSLESELKLQPGRIEIEKLGQEVDGKTKDADVANQDFNALLDSNLELARKLGLRRPPDKPDAS